MYIRDDGRGLAPLMLFLFQVGWEGVGRAVELGLTELSKGKDCQLAFFDFLLAGSNQLCFPCAEHPHKENGCLLFTMYACRVPH